MFDSAGFLTSVTSSRNGTTLDSHTYLRDAVGNITQETLAGPTNSTSVFAYDDLYRLTSATVSATSYVWSYDQVGNRLSQTAGGVTTPYTYNAADQLTAVNGATVTSDLDGNVTNDGAGGVYTWDARSRLVGLSKNGNTYVFKYGPDNLRTYKSVNGIVTQYMLDGDQVVTEIINGVANQTLYGPGTDHPLARNGEYFLPNHESSTTGLTDGSGNLTQSYVYGPFGELLNSPTDSNPFQYTGREDDGDSLIYYRARYYQPNWGRFLSADPLGVDQRAKIASTLGDVDGGAFADSLSSEGMDGGQLGAAAAYQLGVCAAGLTGPANPFIYAEDNPISYTDPTGRRAKIKPSDLVREGKRRGWRWDPASGKRAPHAGQLWPPDGSYPPVTVPNTHGQGKYNEKDLERDMDRIQEYPEVPFAGISASDVLEAVGGVTFYEVIIWGGATLLAPETGGLSYGAALLAQ